jgi:hypothetical protein
MKKTNPSKLKEVLGRFIITLPGGRAIIRARFQHNEQRRLARIGDTESIFNHHFETNEWHSKESISGPGSTIAYTENIRKEIPLLVNRLAVKTIFDAPCGDYNWFRMIRWERPVTYIGGDIVQPLVERNQSFYGSAVTKFIKIDIVHDILPSADLWLCRDCLFHLSTGDIMLVIDNFFRSEIPYLLTSTHSACTENWNIPTGSFRQLNLQLHPFSFCKPIMMIDDWIKGSPVRQLALWDRETLMSSFASNKTFHQTLQSSRR